MKHCVPRGSDSRLPDRQVAGLDGTRIVTVGGVLGALAASSCCVVPVILISLGLSGAWLGKLTVFAPYSAYFIAFTLACLSVGFYFVYRRPVVCIEGSNCDQPGAGRLVKVALFSATVLVATAIALPYVAQYLIAA